MLAKTQVTQQKTDVEARLLKRVVLAFLSVYSDEGLASETSVSYLLLFTVFNLSFYHIVSLETPTQLILVL